MVRTIRAGEHRRSDELVSSGLVMIGEPSGGGGGDGGAADVGEGVAGGVALDQTIGDAAHHLQ